MDAIIDYKKYRWFYTAAGHLVVGGKNSAQNDLLLQEIKKTRKKYVVMHTRDPGSPFCVILAEKTSKSDREQCAIFTGAFSQAWKSGKSKTQVDIFNSDQIYKLPTMKQGTWGVRSPVETVTVSLILSLVYQEEVLRAVPPQAAKNNKTLMMICPGKINKQDLITKFELEGKDVVNPSELLSALPAGGSRVYRK